MLTKYPQNTMYEMDHFLIARYVQLNFNYTYQSYSLLFFFCSPWRAYSSFRFVKILFSFKTFHSTNSFPVINKRPGSFMRTFLLLYCFRTVIGIIISLICSKKRFTSDTWFDTICSLSTVWRNHFAIVLIYKSSINYREVGNSF